VIVMAVTPTRVQTLVPRFTHMIGNSLACV
jgi:hypothetical protein